MLEVSEVGARMCSALPSGDNFPSSGGAIDKGGRRSARSGPFGVLRARSKDSGQRR